MRSRILASLPLALGLALAPTSARAQTTLDSGSFRLTRAGQEVGTESFTIRQDGSGPAAVVIAQGTVALDTSKVTQELTSWLRIAPGGGRTTEYRLKIQGTAPERLTGALAGGRFSARILSPAGEMMREYLASAGAVVVDDGIVHQYYFLAREVGSNTSRVAIIIPRQNRQVLVTVALAPAQPLDIDGHRVQARLLRITGAGLPERQLWVDARGRVLRLAIPALQLVATRTALPG